jgi:arsenate reductase
MQHNEKQNDERVVVFVCEHGSAKSIVAAAYFDKLARERGLNLSAVARGTHPDERIAPAAAKGLAADGLSAGEKPARLSKSDTTRAIRIVAFCDLPADLADRPVEHWQVPAVGEDYRAARKAIVRNLSRLLDDLKNNA